LAGTYVRGDAGCGNHGLDPYDKVAVATGPRRELQAVLDEKAPSNLADWTLRDSKEARALLESIKGKS
jgi:hypothetical protein